MHNILFFLTLADVGLRLLFHQLDHGDVVTLLGRVVGCSSILSYLLLLMHHELLLLLLLLLLILEEDQEHLLLLRSQLLLPGQ